MPLACVLRTPSARNPLLTPPSAATHRRDRLAGVRTPTGWDSGGRLATSPVPQHRPGLGRPQPARDRRPGRVAAVHRPHPRRHRTPWQQTNCHPFRQAAGSSPITASSTATSTCGAICCWPWTPRSSAGSRGRRTPSSCSTSPQLGLDDDPLRALERMAGFVEETGRRHGIAEPLQMTVAVSDGKRLYAARYASGPGRQLLSCPPMRAPCALYPDDERLAPVLGGVPRCGLRAAGDLPGCGEVPAGRRSWSRPAMTSTSRSRRARRAGTPFSGARTAAR